MDTVARSAAANGPIDRPCCALLRALSPNTLSPNALSPAARPVASICHLLRAAARPPDAPLRAAHHLERSTGPEMPTVVRRESGPAASGAARGQQWEGPPDPQWRRRRPSCLAHCALASPRGPTKAHNKGQPLALVAAETRSRSCSVGPTRLDRLRHANSMTKDTPEQLHLNSPSASLCLWPNLSLSLNLNFFNLILMLIFEPLKERQQWRPPRAADTLSRFKLSLALKWRSGLVQFGSV